MLFGSRVFSAVDNFALTFDFLDIGSLIGENRIGEHGRINLV
ncbi:MAG: hypothetical protein QNJ57_11655 [Flavobacteriaceae bacterium]|nr:hypothetical protein [Flavobacteriaceae bacterium]